MFKHIKPLLLVLTISLALTPTITGSSYRRFFDVDASGSAVVLEFSVIFVKIMDYGVVSIYMSPNGAYAYGYTVLKNPGEEKPRIYIHAGLQNETFSGGYLDSTTMKARLVVLIRLNKTIALHRAGFNATSFIYNAPILFNRIDRVVVASINITGRGTEAPSLYIRYVKIISLSTVTENDLVKLMNIDEEINGYSKVLIEGETVGSSHQLRDRGLSIITIVLLVIPPLSTAVVLVTLWWRKKKRRV